MVERTFILPPQSLMGAVDGLTRNSVITKSPLDEKYGLAVDNTSAYEILTEQNAKEEAEELRAKEEAAAAKQKAKEDAAAAKKKEKEEAAEKKKKEKRAEKIMNKTVGRAASSAFGTIGREIGKSILRGLFGNSK